MKTSLLRTWLAACLLAFGLLTSASTINSLLTEDRNTGETVTRIEGMSSLWAQLPNPPDSLTPFKAWDTMDKAAFDLYLIAIKGSVGPPVVVGTQAAKATAESAMELAEAGLHTAENAMEDFNTSALIQGRGQFPAGTASREVIDAIPTQPATQLPGQAIITAATSPGPGQAHLEFEAPHMTSGDVLHKAPARPTSSKSPTTSSRSSSTPPASPPARTNTRSSPATPVATAPKAP